MRELPPARAVFSNSRTEASWPAASIAAAQPARPAPTIRTSVSAGGSGGIGGSLGRASQNARRRRADNVGLEARRGGITEETHEPKNSMPRRQAVQERLWD